MSNILVVLADHRKECQSEVCAACDCGWDLTAAEYAALDRDWLAYPAWEAHLVEKIGGDT